MTTPRVTGTVRSKNPLKGAVEVIPERLYYAALPKLPPSHNILASLPRRKKDGEKKQIHFFCIDNELVYWNFFLDFGPLNLGQLMRFCKKLNDKLRKFPAVCFYSSIDNAKRTNAIHLICCWQILYLERTPEQAYAGFDRRVRVPDDGNHTLPPVSQSQGAVTIAPLPDFHDASPCQCTYDLQVMDCLRGLVVALRHGFFDPESFDVDEYEYFEQVENGDLNWLVKDKILAFAGPSYERHVSPEGYCTLAPADYIPYFQQRNVGLVVRLNKKFYNEQDFIDAGIDHLEAFFIDGSCPSLEILRGVVNAFEQTGDRAFAVHCKAGLGRTGTCIGAYLMKHYGITAKEVIAWMRMCRPGSVIGPQQQYLEKVQNLMWEEGVREGYLDRLPTDDHGSSGSRHYTRDLRDHAEDAVSGRAGQADGLRAARTRPSTTTTTITTTPSTPETRSKTSVVAAVTPPAPSNNTLWCG